MPLSIEDLEGYLQGKGVSPERLKTECSDGHLLTISCDVDDWETQAPHFGLGAGDVKAIKREHDEEATRRHAMLVKWKQINAFTATYRELMSVFLKTNRADLARNVCDIIAESEVGGTPPPPEQPDSKPLLPQLRVLKGSSGKVVKVKESVCAYWKDVATQLGFSSGLMKTIRKGNDGPEEQFDDMIERWLNGTEGTRQPISWKTLLTVLREIEHNVLASDLEKLLPEAQQPEN